MLPYVTELKMYAKYIFEIKYYIKIKWIDHERQSVCLIRINTILIMCFLFLKILLY